MQRNLRITSQLSATANPFRPFPLKYTPAFVLKAVVVGLTLFPIRLAVLAVSLLGGSLVGVVASLGADMKRPKPSRLRRLLLQPIRLFARCCLWSLGYWWIPIERRPGSAAGSARVFVVAPHYSLLDAFILTWLELPCSVAKAGAHVRSRWRARSCTGPELQRPPHAPSPMHAPSPINCVPPVYPCVFETRPPLSQLSPRCPSSGGRRWRCRRSSSTARTRTPSTSASRPSKSAPPVPRGPRSTSSPRARAPTARPSSRSSRAPSSRAPPCSPSSSATPSRISVRAPGLPSRRCAGGAVGAAHGGRAPPL